MADQSHDGHNKIYIIVVQELEQEVIIYLTMLGYFLGKQDKQEKKIDADISHLFNTKLKAQFCQICSKNPATKVAFGKQFQPSFTCANCQITAVGGSVQRLGPKYLIPVQKYSEQLAKQLMNYQSNRKNPTVEQKKMGEDCDSSIAKAKELSSKIMEEYKKMKATTKNKHQQLLEESKHENIIPVFEEISKLGKEKKLQEVENGRNILKRSMVNTKGLTFIDEQALQVRNQGINDRFQAVRKESKIKLKPLEDLIDEINGVEF